MTPSHAPVPDFTAPGVETWLTEGLAVAQRMLRAQAHESAELAAAVHALAAAVAWESPAARAFRVAAEILARGTSGVAATLDDVHVEAIRLRGRALLAAGVG